MMISAPLVASGITLDPASIIDSWHTANHWEGVTAGLITTGILAACWKMKPLPNKAMSAARAFALYFACFMAFCFFTAEYWRLFRAVVISFIGMFV